MRSQPPWAVFPAVKHVIGVKENPFGGRCPTENTTGSSKSPLCPTDPADCLLFYTKTGEKRNEICTFTQCPWHRAGTELSEPDACLIAVIFFLLPNLMLVPF